MKGNFIHKYCHCYVLIANYQSLRQNENIVPCMHLHLPLLCLTSSKNAILGLRDFCQWGHSRMQLPIYATQGLVTKYLKSWSIT